MRYVYFSLHLYLFSCLHNTYLLSPLKKQHIKSWKSRLPKQKWQDSSKSSIFTCFKPVITSIINSMTRKSNGLKPVHLFPVYLPAHPLMKSTLRWTCTKRFRNRHQVSLPGKKWSPIAQRIRCLFVGEKGHVSRTDFSEKNPFKKSKKSVLGWIFFWGGSKLKSDLRVVDDFVDESSRGTSREP